MSKLPFIFESLCACQARWGDSSIPLTLSYLHTCMREQLRGTVASCPMIHQPLALCDSLFMDGRKPSHYTSVKSSVFSSHSGNNQFHFNPTGPNVFILLLLFTFQAGCWNLHAIFLLAHQIWDCWLLELCLFNGFWLKKKLSQEGFLLNVKNCFKKSKLNIFTEKPD